MSNILKKILNAVQRSPNAVPDIHTSVRPGDGVGDPIPYNGARITVDHEFLKKCKSLARYSGAFQLNDDTVMKTGEATRMSEAAAMRMVAAKTTIPVPKVLDAYVQESDGRCVIIMEFVAGERLDAAWLKCSPDQQAHIIAQLRAYLKELRILTSETICAVDGTSCNDQFFTDGEDAEHGPYMTHAHFTEALRKVLLARSDNSWSRMVSQFVASLDSKDFVLTHNDLAPRNILVRDGEIVAILDWELCGFFPDYWEYIKCYLWSEWDTAWANDRIPDQILSPRLQELAYLLHARDILR